MKTTDIQNDIFNFETETLSVPILEVYPNKWNPNTQSPEVFEKLKNAITKYGFLHPILVRKIKNGYEIIDGYHRFKAMESLSNNTITVNCIKQEVPDLAAKFLTLISNKLRGEHDIIKEARIYLEAKEKGQSGLFDQLPEEAGEIESALKFLDKWPLDQFDNAKLESEEDKDPYADLLELLLKTEGPARNFHKKSRSSTMRAWLDTYLQLVDKYKQMKDDK